MAYCISGDVTIVTERSQCFYHTIESLSKIKCSLFIICNFNKISNIHDKMMMTQNLFHSIQVLVNICTIKESLFSIQSTYPNTHYKY